MAAPHATLKVYAPLESFAPSEQERLRAAVAAPSALVLSRSRGLAAAEDADGADVISTGDRVYVCPHRSRLRIVAALVAFRGTIPQQAADAFMPPGEAERAVEEMERIRREHPDWRSHVVTSTWEVPLRWFVAFEDEEREVDPDTKTVRYRTSMTAARARTHRALRAARSATLDEGVVTLVSELAEWLQGFHSGSLVELDYGEVGRLFRRDQMLADRSAGDVQAAITALLEDDLLEATHHYMRAAERWAPLSALERLN